MPQNTIKMASAFMLAACSGAVIADTGTYLGAEVGYADIRHSSYDDTSSFNGYLGWKFLEGLGVEFAYGSLGEFDVSASDNNNSIEVDNVKQIALVFTGPFTKRLSTEMNIKAGYYDLDVTPSISNGSSEGFSENGFTVAYGIAQPIGEHFAATFNWQYYWNVAEVEISTYSLGVRFNF